MYNNQAIALGLLGGAALVFLAVTIRIRRADGPDTAITAPTGSQVTIGADGKVEVVLPAAATAQHESMAMVLPVRPLTEDRLAAIPGARLALDRQQTAAARLGLPVQITNSLGMRLMLIPPGEFEMGSTREFIAAEIQRVRQSRAPGNYWTMVLSEEPRHRVRISRAFYLGACAVTQAEYEKLMGVNPSDLADQQPGAAASEPAARDAAQHTLAIAGKPAGRDTRRHPVDRVLWEEAREFCRKLSSLPAERAAGRSYRLPTEAEWEYACRAGTAARWFPGEAEGDLLSCAWFEANAEDRTHAVGQKTPNAWGLYDMHGNVWQWCADWFDAGYYRRSPEKDPNGALAGTVRVKRGGCFSRGAAYCRSAARGSGRAADREAGNGFRVVLEIAAGVESGDRQPDSAPTVAPPRAARPDQPPPAAAEASFDSPKAQAHQKAWARHFRLSVVETNSIGMRLAVIPPGTFDMGSRPEEVARALRNAQQDEESPSYPTQVQAETPEHRVRISKPFCLGVYPVTQREYAQVMGVNPSSFTEKQREAASFTPPLDLKDTQERAENLHQVRGQDTSRHPVEMVTWDDALEFCQRLSALPAERAAGRSYRLPSEAEWEHACRAGTTTRWFAGDDVADLPSSAWFAENAQGTTHAVGQKRPNAWGLHDMQGNVWQWCADWFNPDYYKHSPASDPRGPTIGSMCVMRGGSWFSPAQSCRSAFRLASGPGTRNARGGFRVAMDLPEFSPAEPTSP